MDGLLKQLHGISEARSRPRSGGHRPGRRGPIAHIQTGSRQRTRHDSGWAIVPADHHAGIKGQDFEPKQPSLYKGAYDYAALLSRPVPDTFPGPEGPRRRNLALSRTRRKLNLPR
jgi:hypothetical protein